MVYTCLYPQTYIIFLYPSSYLIEQGPNTLPNLLMMMVILHSILLQSLVTMKLLRLFLGQNPSQKR